MDRTPDAERGHPLHRFTGRLHAVLDELGQPVSWSLTEGELTEMVTELVGGIARLQGQLLSLLADADRSDVGAGQGAVNTAAWLRGHTRVTGAEATRLVKTARTLEKHEPVRDALIEGSIGLEQAREITTAVDALPDEIAEVAEQKPKAEQHLLEAAREHDAKALRALGRHLLEVVAPDRADELIEQRLEREEAEARKTCFLRTWDDGHGSTWGRFKIPHLHGHLLATLVGAVANPETKDPIPRTGAGSGQVYGEALCRLLEAIPPTWVPTSGGVNATVLVTMTHDTLIGGLQAASLLGTDQQLSPSAARRLAAKAGIIPVVLGGKSQILDLGRRRYFNEPQRLAMALRQGGFCNIKGCQRPATWCHGHHAKTPWSQGGLTTLDNGELPCSRHHTLIHQGFDYPRRT